MTVPNTPEPAETSPEQPEAVGRTGVWPWIRKRPVRSALLALAALVIFDLALLPWGAVNALVRTNPETTAFQQAHLDRERTARRKGRIVKQWRSIDRMSEYLIAAVIVAEDGMFWKHSGIDWFEVRESFVRNIRDQRASRGASTITQQLIKNLFLSPSKNPFRKYHEVLLTLYAERVLTKRRILELYLNEIEWGRGIYGAEAAARTYFGVGAGELSRDQAVRLAAVIPNPIRFQPNSDSRAVLRRADIVRRRLEAREPVRGRAEDLPMDDLADAAPTDTLAPSDSATPPDTNRRRDTLVTTLPKFPADTLLKKP